MIRYHFNCHSSPSPEILVTIIWQNITLVVLLKIHHENEYWITQKYLLSSLLLVALSCCPSSKELVQKSVLGSSLPPIFIIITILWVMSISMSDSRVIDWPRVSQQEMQMSIVLNLGMSSPLAQDSNHDATLSSNKHWFDNHITLKYLISFPTAPPDYQCFIRIFSQVSLPRTIICRFPWEKGMMIKPICIVDMLA